MCEFISWIEYKDEILYVTSKDLESSRGKKLLKKTQCLDDRLGHGFIRAFYDIKQNKGFDKECTDFSNPLNFPKPIVKDIKKGLFRGFGSPHELLSKPAWAEYEKVKQTALAEYQKVKQPALAEYQKVEQTAVAEYQKVKQTALAEYEKVEQPAWAEYEKVEQPAWAEYQKVEQPAWAEYQKVEQTAFWELFAKKKNRNKLWQ